MTIIEAALVSSVYKKVFQTLSLKHLFRVPMGPEKSWNLSLDFSGSEKYWNWTEVLKKSWKGREYD